MTNSIDKSRLALGIRQPWAELIVRGVKTIEVRKFDVNVRGRIYVYASRQVSDHPAAAVAATGHQLDLETLPRGVVVGSVELVETRVMTSDDAAAACLREDDLRAHRFIGWRLANPERYEEPLPIRFMPYGIWFYPFRPRSRQDS
ncbi:MAG: ASCH domain-containing protein [Planctomycetaceae bacterium]|nr:ASCH domain-containing protein [Planctomycetaceae bacterium]